MSDLKYLQYAQLIIFTGFLISAVALIINLIKEHLNKNK
jgi:hypothetical protein